MRARILILAALAATLVGGCGAVHQRRVQRLHRPSNPDVWLTSVHEGARTPCASSRCGRYAATLHWSSIRSPGAAGYDLYANGRHVGFATSNHFTFYGLACGTTVRLGVEAHSTSGGTRQLYKALYSTPACPNRTTNCFSSPGACGYPDPSYDGGTVGVADCSSLTTVTGSNLASVLPAGSYYYSGSGTTLEVTKSNVTWQNLNFAGWQMYVEPGTSNFTLNNDCVSVGNIGSSSMINDQGTDLTIENSTIGGINNTTEANAANSISCPPHRPLGPAI